MKTTGIFTISLDFELHWGMFDVETRQERLAIYQNTLSIIPDMLALFEKYQVHATWATVGSLFAKNQEEWEALRPERKPNYHNAKLSAYKWVEEHGQLDTFKEAHFAPDSIKAIQQCPGQEIGSHTFSHYYCLKPGQGPEDFKADLEAMNNAASNLGITPVSLVLPRNQFNQAYLKACYEAGYKVLRTNPKNWLYATSKNLGHRVVKKAYRSTDMYLPLGNEMTYSLESIQVSNGIPILLPRGRYFWPWEPGKGVLNTLHLKRAMAEINTAAKQGRCCHIWWHPEDFGIHPKENLKQLERLLQQYEYSRERFGMESWNMGEYAANLTGSTALTTTAYTSQNVLVK